MPASPVVQQSTIEVDEDFFPTPAVKLVVTQYLEIFDDISAWAWIIVGAFYDRDDQKIWSSEIRISQTGDYSDSDSSSSAAESVGESDNETTYYGSEEESGSRE